MIYQNGDIKTREKAYIDFKTMYKEKLLPSYLKQNPTRGLEDVIGGRIKEHYMIWENANFKPTDVVYEFGAWSTFFAIMVADITYHITTTDNFAWTRLYGMGKTGNDMEEQQWLDELNRKRPNLKAEYADIQNTLYPDEHFDKIISVSVLEHVEDDLKALEECARILKDDGLVSMTVDFATNRVFKPYENISNDKTRAYTIPTFVKLINMSPFYFDEYLLPTHKEKDAVPSEFSVFAVGVNLKKK